VRGKRNGRRAVAAVVFMALVMTATYAFTAANTVAASKAGDGAGAVTGYNVTGVHYTLNGTDPGVIDTVTFNLDSAPVAGSTIRARLNPTGTWYSCTNTGVAVTCTTTGATVLGATELRVVVAQ
jgi:hypothetical protein